MKIRIYLGLLTCFAGPLLRAEVLTVDLHNIDDRGVRTVIGNVTFSERPEGLLIQHEIDGLPPGPHGFHLHENPSCDPSEKDGAVQAGAAAGHHYDPAESGRHEGPQGTGHLGDLPILNVDEAGRAIGALTVPRLKVSDLKGRAVIVHAGSDNYSDQPEKGGGGGARIACGVIH
ncbi:MAG: superoxide dismutase family protein [Rhodospirillales bacterium]|nr:superoxide dismutase family protein [Rhodospirillales bacterium]